MPKETVCDSLSRPLECLRNSHFGNWLVKSYYRIHKKFEGFVLVCGSLPWGRYPYSRVTPGSITEAYPILYSMRGNKLTPIPEKFWENSVKVNLRDYSILWHEVTVNQKQKCTTWIPVSCFTPTSLCLPVSLSDYILYLETDSMNIIVTSTTMGINTPAI